MLPDKVILRLENIHLSFKGIYLFENLNATFSSGKVNILRGENGAGKTTLFNLICGVLKPEKGSIYLNKVNITRYSFTDRAKLGILRTFQEPRIFKFMTVCENSMFSFRDLPFEKFFRSLFKNTSKEQEQIAKLLKQFDLDKYCKSKAENLSLGNQRLLNLLTVLNSKAKVYLLDEPFAGINPVFFEAIISKIKKLALNSLVIVIEHSEENIEALEGEVYLLEKGKIVNV